MIRLAICDDDIKVLSVLQKMIETQYGDQIQVTRYQSSEEILFTYEEKKYIPFDIILIDIVLKRENGIELAKKLQTASRRVKIIFITGYLEFAPDIFEIEPVYLLKKPVSAIKLVDAIDKAIEKIDKEEKQLITLCAKGTIFQVNVGCISYVESDGRKLLVHQNENVLSIYMKLDDLEKKLGEMFLRCHHSYLVNMSFIKKFSTKEILLMDDTVIPVSRPKSNYAKGRFMGYLGERI